MNFYSTFHNFMFFLEGKYALIKPPEGVKKSNIHRSTYPWKTSSKQLIWNDRKRTDGTNNTFHIRNQQILRLYVVCVWLMWCLRRWAVRWPCRKTLQSSSNRGEQDMWRQFWNETDETRSKNGPTIGTTKRHSSHKCILSAAKLNTDCGNPKFKKVAQSIPEGSRGRCFKASTRWASL